MKTQKNYDVDSDSDVDAENSGTNKEYPLVQDIQSLKSQTLELLDPVWKDSRNKQLLMKMLRLEESNITVKMVDFLLQEGVIEILLGFITLVGTGHPRPTPVDAQSESLKLSFKAVAVLSAEEPSEPLINLFSKRAVSITRAMFEIFRDDSAASFYHAFRIFECLLRCYPGDVYEGMCGDGKLSERMFSLFKYIGFAPIGELLVMIVALTPLSRVSPLYNSCTKNRWTFFEALSQWGCLKRLTDVIVRPELFCKVTNEVDAEEHSSAAAQVFQELVEKLSLEDIGEVLLQPLGFSSDLLDTLVNASTSSTVDTSRRRTAVQILCFLLRRAAEPEVMCMVAGGPGNVATPSIVANRLHPLRERIISHLETRIGEVFNIILSFDSPSVPNSVSDVKGPIKYSAYKVDQPFTSMRSLLIEYMTLMAESDEMIATMMPLKLWRTLTKWILQYPANSIYQSYFYRLVFAVIRQNQEDALRTLFQRGRLISYLAETYVPLPSPSAPMPKKTAVDMINKMACRGLIVNCASAIRLQAQCLPPNSFLRQFLSAHPRWNSFINTIVGASEHQQLFGMGIRIMEARNSMAGVSSFMMMAPAEFKPDPSDSSIDHGSRFARNLGFFEDGPYNGDPDPRVDFGDLKEMSLDA